MKISKMEYSKINLQQGNIEIFGIWNIPGIFQKNLQQGKYWNFWNMEYNRNYQKIDFPCKIEFFVGNINYVIFQKNLQHKKSWIFLEYGIFQKILKQEKSWLFGIWNIPGIFQKNIETSEILIILEYGIFHGIFLEYSKKCKTSFGGVKFNQVL